MIYIVIYVVDNVRSKQKIGFIGNETLIINMEKVINNILLIMRDVREMFTPLYAAVV